MPVCGDVVLLGLRDSQLVRLRPRLDWTGGVFLDVTQLGGASVSLSDGLLDSLVRLCSWPLRCGHR